MRRIEVKKIALAMLIIIPAIAGQNALGQVWLEWSDLFNGPEDGADVTAANGLAPNGAVFVTGISYNGNGTSSNYTTLRYSPAGILEWAATYDGAVDGFDEPFALVACSQGGVCVTGISVGSQTSWDIATVKYRSDGSWQWTARYDGLQHGQDWAFDIAEDNRGNILVAGFTDVYPGSGDSFDYVTIKYDSCGNELWNVTYNGPADGEDVAMALGLDSEDNVFVTGYSYGGDSTYADILTIKYSPSAEVLWVARYDGPGLLGYDAGAALAVDESGGVYVAGESCSEGRVSWPDAVILKYDGDGIHQWTFREQGDGWSGAHLGSIELGANGCVLACGSIDVDTSYYYENKDWLIVGCDADGQLNWEQTLSGNMYFIYDAATAIATDDQGNAYVTGTIYNSGRQDCATVKYDSLGSVQWMMTYENAGAGDLKVGSDQCVYLAGCYSGDLLTLKYNQTLGVEKPPVSQIPNQFTLFPPYPNPFNAGVLVRFELAQAGPVDLTVYDTKGQLVATLVKGWRSAGNHVEEFDGTGLSSGNYVCRLRTQRGTALQKMVLLK